MKKIILASGGSGGHIFPALALAELLSQSGYEPILLTDERYKKFAASTNIDIEVHYIKSGTTGSGLLKKAKTAYQLSAGIFQSRKLLQKIQPDVVVGFGGYPSFPTMFSACGLGFKTIIHEQNSLLGRANAMLAKKVDVIATSFEKVMGIADADNKKIHLTGNPVRKSIKAIREINYPDFTESGILHILVTGGSQGASVFSDVVPDAIAKLPKHMQARIRVDQQCRAADIAEVRKKYKNLNISANVATFFNDIPARLTACHLVISRAGASTLAEISVAGRPVIMVPYPHAMDDHQRINANALEESGGGWVMTQEAFSPETLSVKLESFLNLPNLLIDAAEKSRNIGQPNADRQLFNIVESMIDNGGEVLDEQEVDLSKIDEIESKG